ncbi:hypothetical protein HNV12_11835 [Methanococcoides sp. SA1]|nr:hypothetical protein [Methanococcoides sp. SA1]
MSEIEAVSITIDDMEPIVPANAPATMKEPETVTEAVGQGIFGIIFGLGFVGIGLVLCCSIIGAIIGLPLIFIGLSMAGVMTLDSAKGVAKNMKK